MVSEDWLVENAMESMPPALLALHGDADVRNPTIR